MNKTFIPGNLYKLIKDTRDNEYVRTIDCFKRVDPTTNSGCRIESSVIPLKSYALFIEQVPGPYRYHLFLIGKDLYEININSLQYVEVT